MNQSEQPKERQSYVSLDATASALLTACPDPAFIVGGGGAILAANDEAARMFDLTSSEDLTRRNLYDLLPADMLQIRKEKIREAARRGRNSRFEEDVNGRSYVHTVVPIGEDSRGDLRVAVCSQDMTRLRRTDEDLRREQQRQIFFMESLPGLVFHIYPDESIRYANRYFRKLFGSPKGLSCRELVRCDGGNCSLCPPRDAMDHDIAVERDWTSPSGKTFHIQYSPMTDSSGERMVMALGLDITARKEAEDKLKHARDELEHRVRQRTHELEDANEQLRAKSVNLVKAKKKADAAARAKSKFLANMSHEVRTPLNAILGMTDLALQATDNQARQEYLNNVLEAGTSLLTVINDILDFSKIEAQKLTLESLDFEIRHLVSGTVTMHRPAAEAKGLVLSYTVDDDVPDALRGDPSRLRQVLVNLIGNAIKFTQSGSVLVSVHYDTLLDNGHHRLRFSVTDTGIGIPEDKQKLIFDSFLQADDSVTRKHGGTGLGLAICRLLVELMHGRMGLSSKKNEGSTFTFTAEFGMPSGQQEIEPDELPTEIPNLSILLADDNRLNRQLAATVLREKGHDVTSVENGQEVLELLRAAKFDLVLMDVQMPVMDGVSATHAIRTQGSGVLNPDIPIIAITAHALKGDRERFLAAGMNGYVSKPIRIKELMLAIAGALDSMIGSAQPDTPVKTPDELRFDRKTALSLLDDRNELMDMMDGIFLREAPMDLDTVHEAISTGDMDTAKRSAHSIKGAARTVGAVKAGSIAEQLEYQCGKGELTAARETLRILKSELQAALDFIAQSHGRPHSSRQEGGSE